jgi:Ricin-type beta-trefoil lectin domain-like/Malectin domain/Domain of unknown function (DUF3472)
MHFERGNAMKIRLVMALAVASTVCVFAARANAQDLTLSTYQGTPDANILQNQVMIHKTVPDTYYSLVANNWGYGGLQMNDSTSQRTILFSLWDWNNEESTVYAFNPNLTAVKNGRFGGEGTGVQFLFDFPWKFEHNYRAALRVYAEPDHIHARFSGFFYDPAIGVWKYAVTERANTQGQGTFSGGSFYSFAESYGGVSGLRDATMNNAWSYLTGTGWTEYDGGIEFNNSQESIAFGGVYTSAKGFEFKSCPTCKAMAEDTTVGYTPTEEAPVVVPFHLSCGNINAAGDWEPDGYYADNAGDSTAVAISTPVNTWLIPSPAPQGVYQNLRSGSDFQYNLFGFLPDTSYVVNLRFVEPTAGETGQRKENVAINGNNVLREFDIFRAAGGKDRAIERTFRAKTNSSGEITIQFTKALGSNLPAIVTALSTATESESQASASLAPSTLKFATTKVNTSSPAQQVSLRNTGTVPLAISSITTSQGFAETNNCGTTLARNRSCVISVTFDPFVNGSQTGALMVMDNASHGVLDAVALSGEGTGGTGPANGTYTITNAASGLLWDDPGSSTASGTNIDLYSATGNPNQKWTFTALGGGYYEIVNVASGLSLNDPGSSTTAGTQLIQYGYQGTSNEQWLLAPSGNGFVITGKASGLVIDPAANTSGAYIQQEPANGTAAQIWVIQ